MHYAFRYFDSENTTTGTPNSRTGRLSIAGHLSVFTSKSDRDEFVGRTEAVAVTPKQARNLHLGMTTSEYGALVTVICDWDKAD